MVVTTVVVGGGSDGISVLLLRIAPYRLIDMKQTLFPPFHKQHSRPKRNRQKNEITFPQ